MQIDLIFKIAAIGILVSVFNQLLIRHFAYSVIRLTDDIVCFVFYYLFIGFQMKMTTLFCILQ